MKQSLLAGAAAGAASAALVFFVLQSTGAGSATPPAAAAAGPAAAGPESGRIDALGDQVTRLENELAMLEGVLSNMRGMDASQLAARAPIEGALGGLAPEEIESLKQLASVANKGELSPVPSDYNAVRSTLEQIREEEAAAEEAARRERDLERIERDLERLNEALGLVGYQTDGLRDIMVGELDKRTALVSEARESGDWMIMRDGMRDIRDEAQGQISELLGPDLYSEYEKNNDSRRGGFGGFGGGGSRGGGNF